MSGERTIGVWLLIRRIEPVEVPVGVENFVDETALLELATEAVAASAAEVMELFTDPAGLLVSAKESPADVVTEADVIGERIVTEVILGARPDDSFIGEEGTRIAGSSSVTWVLDPVDSTANFARGIPIWSISLAAVVDGDIRIAVVAYPPAGEVYSANSSTGILLNGSPIGPRPMRSLEASMFGIGWGPNAAPGRHGVVADGLIPRVGKVRSPGSPALGLSWAAIGRFDAVYYEMDFNEWDIRAGAFLCEQGGLRVGEFQPTDPHVSPRLLAAPDHLWDYFAAVVFDQGSL